MTGPRCPCPPLLHSRPHNLRRTPWQSTSSSLTPAWTTNRGKVTALKDQIQTEYHAFTRQDLHCFFDADDIQGMDDWQHPILGGLRDSHLFLLVLSPAYLKSDYCQWKIVEYLKLHYSKAVGGEGVAPVYFVEIPNLADLAWQSQTAAWLAQIRQQHHFDLRPWHEQGR